MNKEDKELLMQDLCGRLPYKLYCDASKWTDEEPRLVLEFCPYYDEELKVTLLSGRLPVEYCRPYLRSISSMTDEEKEEFNRIREIVEVRLFNAVSKDGFTLAFHELDDWLNRHHFDYRGLILRGLAVEAPEDMYKVNVS